MITIFVFILGTVAGSGITAVLHRLETGERWVRGRSRCPRCKKTLGPIELVPLFSWLAQKGRCRGCRSRIASSYPIIELVTGLLFTFGFVMRFGADPLAAFLTDPAGSSLLAFRDFYAICVLIIIFIFDLTHGLILDRVTFPAIMIFALLSWLLGMPPLTLILGMVVGGGFFAAQYAISRGRWIGGGDIMLGMLMGALLGWKLLLVAFFLAYVSGALIAIILVTRGLKAWKSTLPFGTFLAAGALFALYFGEAVVKFYAGS